MQLSRSTQIPSILKSTDLTHDSWCPHPATCISEVHTSHTTPFNFLAALDQKQFSKVQWHSQAFIPLLTHQPRSTPQQLMDSSAMPQYSDTSSVKDFAEDTSYNPHGIRLIDDTDTASDSDASSLIARPTAAYTGSPYIFEKNAVTLPGPLEELTPPPSPGYGSKSPNKLQKRGHKSTNSLSLNFAPLLNRANSIITPRSSANASPTHQNYLSISWPLTDDPPPTESPNTAGDNPSPRRSKTMSGLFQLQGSSAPISFGLVSTPSPKKEAFPEGSPFGPAADARPTSVASRSSAGNTSPTRPGNPRRGSTLSAAASLFGLAASRANSTSPVRKAARPQPRLDDGIMRLDFENEVFPNESLGGKGEKAFDELLANAEKLFIKMRSAYAKKCDALENIEMVRRADGDAIDEERERLEHVKQQLNEMSAKVEERDTEIRDLEEELEARMRRSRSIRKLSPGGGRAPSQSSDRARKIWSADSTGAGDVGNDSGSDSGRESVFDRHSRPSSSSSASTEAAGPDASATQQQKRHSTFWEDAAPFVPPEAALVAENKDLKKRISELEETLSSCLGLVDL